LGAINPNYLKDTRFAKVLGEQFNSLSLENEKKWAFPNPAKGKYNRQTIDRLVDFAEHHDMAVKGHGLISSCCNPDYLLNITNAEASRAAMIAHFEAVMNRYRGKIDHWDVVPESIGAMDGGLQKNYFHNVTGPGYIEDAFHVARAADADAKLFVKENLVESPPGKRQELFDLVSELVAKGTPIDGVALKKHITEAPLVSGVITNVVDSYEALGLEVAIAEMNVHTLNNILETEIYGSVISEALSAGITDVSFWGFTDKHAYTWVPGAKPLMLAGNYKLKVEFYATHSALAEFVDECQ
jgi:GH35 family endo-1,4-beta-xylanase